MKALLEKLTGIPGPSGYESQIRAAVREEVEPLADEVRVDNLGNLIAIYGTKNERGKKIMEGLVEYLIEFAEAFQKVDLSKVLESKD